MKQKCEFCRERPATVYGGYPGAGDWAGYGCDECVGAAAKHGFSIWERVAK
jgi:hypothetical protein